jgi:hypothetical protein
MGICFENIFKIIICFEILIKDKKNMNLTIIASHKNKKSAESNIFVIRR